MKNIITKDSFIQDLKKMGGYELMKKNRLIFCTHEVPKKLQERFPKAKIINLVGDDFRIAQRYMKTTAIFRTSKNEMDRW